MINPPILLQVQDNEWQTVDTINDVSFDNKIWLTLDYKDQESIDRLFQELNLSSTQQEALTDPEIRPRLWVTQNQQILLFIRGINLNPNSEPEDMVSVRIYFDGDKLICLRSRSLQTITQIKSKVLTDSNEFTQLNRLFIYLIEQILVKIEKHVTHLANQLDELEDAVDDGEQVEFKVVEDIRRTSAKLWRYLAPQKDVLTKLMHVNLPWIDTETQHELQELEDEMTYEVEELALVRERCHQLENLLSNKLSQRVNKNLYLISVITAIFIPVSFLTGLLGINVGGMPGIDSSLAFWTVCGILLVLAILEVIYLKHKDWF